MPAYAAISSLKTIILQLCRDFSIPSSVTGIMPSAMDNAESLREVLEQIDDRSGSERVGALEGQIREAAYELEDSLESHVSDLLLSQSEESLGDPSHPLSLDLQEVEQYVDSFIQKVRKIKEEYNDELTNQSSQEYDFGGKMPKMVGLSDKLSNIKDWLMDSILYRLTVTIVGMAGTGKTTLARTIFEDKSILHHFDCRVWVTIGPKYNIDEIRHCIVAQANPENYKKLLEDGNQFSEYYLRRCSASRNLIVLDDVWDYDIYDRLVSSFPPHDNGSRVLVTTRIADVAHRTSAASFRVVEMRSLNEGESWDLLREKVFGKELLCPPQLEKVGKEIAKNCEGYPPQIIRVAELLSKSERNADCWSKMAETANSVFMDANNERLNLVSSTIDFHGKKPVTVGLSDDLTKIKDWLIDSYNPLEAISLFGMAGIGKTTLAKEVFEDPLISSHFDVRVWITVGQKYQLKEILQGIAGQVNPGVDIDIDMLDWHLYKSLKDRRYLIVLDDVWDSQILNYLKSCCPDLRIGSKLLMTTELRDAMHEFRYALAKFRFRVHEMHLLNNEESWCLLRQKVFGEESCPFGLEKAGKKIAEKCEGLPLAIVTVANLLSKENKTPDRWNEIAEAEENSVFYDAYEQMSDKLIPSYNYLPRHLKAIFLYMGVFSKNYVIPRSKLIRIWKAEGFKGDEAEKCSQELTARSLVIVSQKTSSGTTKTCKLHSVFWHLCNRIAQKKKLFHALSKRADGFAEGIKSERRLSVRNSVLFRIKDVHNSMAFISTLRSLLCTGPHYQYSIQICSAWRLLRILDAHTVRFYQFPIETINLVRLRYFAITYNGKLPPFISKLRNLEYLIVHRHLGIKFSEDTSYLPVEIWEMRALKHLQVTGCNLPDPPNGALLEDLLTLLDVSARSCTRRVLEHIPNLAKLGIQIELAHDAVVVPLFDISYLKNMKSFKYVIVNPEVKVVKSPISVLPSANNNLRKLALCGFGYPWEYMSVIKSSFQYLEVLKLRSYAFCGPTPETFEWKLEFLKLLVLEDIDLVHLNGISSCFPRLERLIIKHCYKLKGIPSEIGGMRYLKLIELVDCSPLAVDSAKDIKKQQKKRKDWGYHEIEVRSYSSWK